MTILQKNALKLDDKKSSNPGSQGFVGLSVEFTSKTEKGRGNLLIYTTGSSLPGQFQFLV